MKLKNIIVSILACAAIFTSCEEQISISQLEQLKLSQSTVAIPVDGGSVTVDFEATQSWAFDSTLYEAEWLTVSPVSGEAGTTTVTFSADSTVNNNEVELAILIGEADASGRYLTQYINVVQKDDNVSAEESTILDVLNGVDGKIYRVTGTCTNIINTEYGNWYISDDEGNSLYIYGTLWNGQEKQFLNHGIEVGDIVTVEGPRLNYNGTIELEDVTVIEIEKSLIKVESDPVELPIEGGEFQIKLTCKGDGVSLVIPEEAKSWLSVLSIDQADTVVVTFNAQPNNLGDRSVELTFTTNGGSYSAVTTVFQKGAIIEATAEEINAAEDGETVYRLSGYITYVQNTEYGNFYIADHTDTVYVYGTLDAEGNSKNWASLGINEGDIVTITGPKTSHKGSPQLKNVSVEVHEPVTDVTVEEFLAKEEGDAWYRMTGTISGLTEDNHYRYGNFDLTDATGSIYVYGLHVGYGGPDGEFQELGLDNGATVTLVGKRTSFKDDPQVGDAFYVAPKAE